MHIKFNSRHVLLGILFLTLVTGFLGGRGASDPELVKNELVKDENSPILKACFAYIEDKNMGRGRIDRTMYTFLELDEVTYENYAFEITSDLFNEEAVADYKIAVIGDIHDELHSYAVLLVDPKNNEVLGWQPIK